MVVTNLKEFNNQWILFGFLFFVLIIFTISFMANNSLEGLGDTQAKFDSFKSNSQGNLISMTNTSNKLLNISAQNNPEISNLGSKDSVATSFGVFGNAKRFLTTSLLFISWMFVGTSGQIIVAVIAGMFGLSALYFITKWIRQGA